MCTSEPRVITLSRADTEDERTIRALTSAGFSVSQSRWDAPTYQVGAFALSHPWDETEAWQTIARANRHALGYARECQTFYGYTHTRFAERFAYLWRAIDARDIALLEYELTLMRAWLCDESTSDYWYHLVPAWDTLAGLARSFAPDVPARPRLSYSLQTHKSLVGDTEMSARAYTPDGFTSRPFIDLPYQRANVDGFNSESVVYASPWQRHAVKRLNRELDILPTHPTGACCVWYAGIHVHHARWYRVAR